MKLYDKIGYVVFSGIVVAALVFIVYGLAVTYLK